MRRSTFSAVDACIAMAAAMFVVIALISFCQAAEPDAPLPGHAEKVLGTPHFYQCDPDGQFADDGRNYCLPVSVSDSLVFLASHGFPHLLPGGTTDATAAQIALIKTLASSECMRTDPASGTDAGPACVGIQRYVQSAGYVCRSIEYKGWRPMPNALAAYATATLPSLDWIKQATADPSAAAWVNIGWYVAGANPNEWKRVGGHWVAVVGYGTDGAGQADPNVLLIDNPAISASITPAGHQLADGTESPTRAEVAADVMTVSQATQGRLVGNYRGLPRDAAGMYRVSGQGVHMSKSYDAAFIDGAIVMVIGQRQP